jgi:hypothetical protein
LLSNTQDLLEKERYKPLPIIEDEKDLVDIEEAVRFLKKFVKTEVITVTDKLLVLGASIKGGH